MPCYNIGFRSLPREHPLIEKLCTLVCGAILEEAQAQVEKNREILKSWKRPG